MVIVAWRHGSDHASALFSVSHVLLPGMGHRVITTRESDEKMQVQGECERLEDGAPSAPYRRGLKRKIGEVIADDEEELDHLVVVDDEDADDEDLDDDDDDDDEEEDEDTDTEVRLDPSPLPPLALLRSSSSCRSSNGYNRQSALNVSIHKLNRYRQSADASLRRMVLVYNTMRCIEKEMITEGGKLASANVILLPAMDPPESMTLDPLPPPQMHQLPPPSSSSSNDHQLYHHNLHHNNHHHHNHHHHPHHHHHLLHNNINHHHTHHHHNNHHHHHHSHLNLHSQQHFDMDDNCYDKDTPTAIDATPPTNRHWTSPSAISWSSVLDFSNQTEAESMVPAPCGLRTPEMGTGAALGRVSSVSASDDAWACEGPVVGSNGGGPDTSPSSSSDSGISTASDEIFGDIDLSLYDFDILPPSPPSARFVPPSAEELLRTFADNQSHNGQQQMGTSSVATTPTAPSTAPSLPSVQSHVTVPTIAPASPSPTRLAPVNVQPVPSSTGTSSTTATTTTVTVANGCQGHRNEQLIEELDQIMHILVGM